jgi:hypothetical protein
MFWKVRAIPARAFSSGAFPVTSFPANRIRPPLGFSTPEIRLKAVVLPEPFGPIKPTSSPFATEKDTPSRARTPPKLLASASTARSAGSAVT